MRNSAYNKPKIFPEGSVLYASEAGRTVVKKQEDELAQAKAVVDKADFLRAARDLCK